MVLESCIVWSALNLTCIIIALSVTSSHLLIITGRIIMNLFRRISIIWVITLCSIYTIPTLSAHNAADKEKREQARKEMKSMFAEFAKKEILPSMRQWKSNLDAAMSSEDLATLNTLRKKAKQMRESTQTTANAMRRAWKDEDYEALKKYREQLDNAKDDRIRLALDCKPLAKKYSAVLEKIGEDAKSKAPQWREKGKELVRQWMEKYDIKADGNILDGMKKRFGFLGQGDGKKAALRFMLWDGSEDFINEDKEPLQRKEHNRRDNREDEDEDDIFGYAQPNPFSESTSIVVNIPKEEHVTIDVFDAKGEKLSTLLDSSLPPGLHSIPFTPETMTNGQCTFIIRTPTTQTSGHAIMTK
jgi:hypothetical protein